MQVRPADVSDRDFIIGLSPRFAEFELPAWLDARTVAEGTARQLARAVADRDDDAVILVAEGAGERLGFAWVHLVPDFYGAATIAKISEIAVARDGTGAGSALMAASEAWAAQRGCERIVLNVMEGNDRARRFYHRHGFAPEYTMLVKSLAQQGKGSSGG